jgi:SAM-dependent methyltransferase
MTAPLVSTFRERFSRFFALSQGGDSVREADMEWWKSFFDADYARLWSELTPPARTEQEAEGIWSLLELRAGCPVLDAPCGFGRLSRELALRGARVLGLDISSDLLTEAERRCGEIPDEQLKYAHHDLRYPVSEDGFDAAINIYSSLGYGSEEDDIAILSTIRTAVREGRPSLHRYHASGRVCRAAS